VSKIPSEEGRIGLECGAASTVVDCGWILSLCEWDGDCDGGWWVGHRPAEPRSGAAVRNRNGATT
jgi:hypothetical protein